MLRQGIRHTYHNYNGHHDHLPQVRRSANASPLRSHSCNPIRLQSRPFLYWSGNRPHMHEPYLCQVPGSHQMYHRNESNAAQWQGRSVVKAPSQYQVPYIPQLRFFRTPQREQGRMSLQVQETLASAKSLRRHRSYTPL